MPHYAVTIALEHKGEIVAGVIYDAAQDECFFAEKGQGAWMNETRMRVSGRRSLSDCVFATGSTRCFSSNDEPDDVKSSYDASTTCPSRGIQNDNCTAAAYQSRWEEKTKEKEKQMITLTTQF